MTFPCPPVQKTQFLEKRIKKVMEEILTLWRTTHKKACRSTDFLNYDEEGGVES